MATTSLWRVHGRVDELSQYREMANERIHTLEWERQTQRNRS